MNSRQSKIILGILSALFLVLNILTLKDGHKLGGDFAQYIQHAQNILENNPYHYGLILDAWVLCAPGLPLLLAAVIKFFGINLIAMKFLNIVFWLLFCWVLYRILRDKMDEESAVLAVAVMFLSHSFFIFKQNILTDIPFSFFTAASIFTFEEYLRSEKRNRGILLARFVAAALAAFLFRYAGILLFISAGLYMWFIKRNTKTILPVAAGITAGVLIHFLIGASAQGHFMELPERPADWLMLSYLNISYTLLCFMYFYIPGRTLVELGIQSMIFPAVDLFSLVIIAGLAWDFIRRCRSGKILYSEFFFFIYLFGVIVWPLVDGSRYLFPIIGLGWIILYGVFLRCGEWGKSLVKILAVLILLVNVTGVAADFKFNDDELLQPQLQEVFRWVKENVSEKETVMFRASRELRLFTQKPTVTFWYRENDRRHFSMRVEEFQVRYIINDKERDEFQLTDGMEGAVMLSQVWENDKYRIFKVQLN